MKVVFETERVKECLLEEKHLVESFTVCLSCFSWNIKNCNHLRVQLLESGNVSPVVNVLMPWRLLYWLLACFNRDFKQRGR